MKYITFALVLWMLCITPVVYAQFDTGYENIVVGENHSVKSILQDSHGVIWIGAGNELYSFDGYQCMPHHISADSDFPFTIYHMVMHDEQIYIGSDHGLYIYDCRTGACTRPEIWSKNDIRCILVEGDSLYLGCMEGVYLYQITEQTVRQLCPSLKTVYSLLITPKGLLAGTLSGLYMIHEEDYTAYPIHLFVNFLAHDEGTRYWVGSEGYLFSLDIANDHLEAVAEMQGNDIKTIFKDKQGRLLMGTDNGLYVRDGQQTLHFCHDTGNPLSMKNNNLWSVFIDRHDNLWLGHDAGLSLLCLSQKFTHHPLQKLMDSDDGNYLRRLHIDSRRQLWAGGSNGLLRYPQHPGTSGKTWYRQGNSLHPLTNNFIRCIYEDVDGDIWVATDGGINLYLPEADQMRNFLLYNQDMRFSAKWAYDIFLDTQGRLWVAAYDGGVFVVEKKRLLASKGECMADYHYMACAGGLSGLHVSRLLYTQSGEVWVASNGGIDRIDPQSHRVTHVTDVIAYCMLEDHLHRIWMGYDGGFCYYSANQPQPVDFDLSTSDPYTRIINLQEAQGCIWAFSNSNCRVVDSLGHVSIFRLPASNIASTCYDASSDRFIAGGIDELITFRSDIRELLTARRPFYLSGMQVNNADVNVSDLHTSRPNELHLDSHENNLTLHFTDMPYQGGVSSVYAYRLKGNNDTWLQLDPQSLTIHLVGLPHGHHQLEIASMDGLGRPVEIVYRLPIHIRPPWYMTRWAYLIYLLLALALAWGILKYYRVRKNLAKEEEALQAVLEKQEARSLFFRQLSTEFKRPIANTLIAVSQLCERTHSDEVMHRLGHIQEAATQMNTLLRHAFDLNNRQTTRPSDLIYFDIDLNIFCQQMVSNMQPQAIERDIVLEAEVPQKHIRHTVGIVRFDAILYILLRFAIQHTGQGGHILLTLSLQEGGIHLTLQARETSYPSGDLDYLFQRPWDNASSHDETHSELYLAREYAQAMQAELTAHCDSQGQLQMLLSLPNQGDESAVRSGRSVPASESGASKNDSDERLMAHITATIEKHIMDYDFSVSILQYELGIGSKLLYRKVKSFTGMSPVEYIRSIRMNQAALLLKEGHFSVSEVMYMVGFTNASYFAKCFQKSYGTTPARFAKSNVRHT